MAQGARGAARLAWAAAGLAGGGAGAALLEAPGMPPPPPGPPPPPPGAGAGGLRVVQAQVAFRHGARTPLTKLYGALEPEWRGTPPLEVAGGASAGGIPAKLVALGSRGRAWPPPASSVDVRQRARPLPGGRFHAGELTPLGHAQARELGAWLRRRYGPGGEHPLVGAHFDPREVSARTTNVDRTFQTCAGVLAGLFPTPAGAGAGAGGGGAGGATGEGGAPAPPSAPASPVVEVETTEGEKEWLYPNSACCPRLADLLKSRRAALRSSKSAPLAALEERALAALGSDLAPPEGERLDFIALYDACTSRLAHGVGLPGHVTEELLREIEAEAAHVMAHLVSPTDVYSSDDAASSEEVLRLTAGRHLHEIVGHMEDMAGQKGDSAAGLRLYSAHDTSLMPLLAALGRLEPGTWPPYTSFLVFELACAPPEEGGGHFVRALYNGEVVERLPGAAGGDSATQPGGGWVPLADFQRALEPLLPRDFSAACHAHLAATAGRDPTSAESAPGLDDSSARSDGTSQAKGG